MAARGKSIQLLVILLQISAGLCEMRKTIKVEKLPFPTGSDHAAQFILDVGDQKEATLCMKFRTFAYNEGFGSPFVMFTKCPENMSCVDSFSWIYFILWKSGLEDDGKQAGQTHLKFSHDNQTTYEAVLQRVEMAQWHSNLIEDWVELFEWQSACFAWSVIKKKELLFVNGKFIFGYKWTKQFSKGWSDFPLLLNLMGNWRGEATDVNIYDSFFEEEELISWTTSCGIPADGRILPWKPEIYNLTNNNDTETVISEVDSEDLCPDKNANTNILEIFDNGIGKSPIQSEHWCERLNGELKMVPTTEKDAFEVLKKFNEYTRKRNLTYFNAWLSGRADLEGTEFVETEDGFNLYPKDGIWIAKDSKTNEILGNPFGAIPALDTFSKPTQLCFLCGHHPIEKAISSFEKIYPLSKPCPKDEPDCVNNYYCGTNTCNTKTFPNVAVLCKFKQKLRLRLKGLCKDTKVDTDYLLLGYEVLGEEPNPRRMYGGSTGWLLAHEKEEDIWQLKHHHYPQLTLSMEDKDQLPVGLHSWIAANNTCTLGQTVRLDLSVSQNLYFDLSIQLQLSACLPDQFTCQNGKCVSIDSRCDNVEVGDFFLHYMCVSKRIVTTAATKRIVELLLTMRRNI